MTEPSDNQPAGPEVTEAEASEPEASEPEASEPEVTEAVLTGTVAGGKRARAGTGDVWGVATDPASDVDDTSDISGTGEVNGAGEANGASPAGEAAPSRPVPSRPASSRPASSRPASSRPASSRPASSRPPSSRPAQPPRRSGPDGPDLLGDIQRWLIRSGARSVRREIEDQVRRTLGGGSASRGSGADVWDRATTEPPPELTEAPECAWCPVCQAARRMRESGPGLGSQLAGASDAVATAVQHALGAVDAIMSRPGAGPGPRRAAEKSPGSGQPGSGQPDPGPPGPGSPDSAGDEAGRVPDEPGDRG